MTVNERAIRQETQGCRSSLNLESTRRTLLAGALIVVPALGSSPGTNALVYNDSVVIVNLACPLRMKRDTLSWAENILSLVFDHASRQG